MKDIISKRRKELGLTQQELADKLFVSDKVISKWETGKSVPDTSILVELASVLEISLDDLLKSGRESTNQNIKVAIADKLETKYNNLLLMTTLFIIFGTILYCAGRLIDFNDGHRENKIIVIIFYVLATLIIIASLFYFLINRNKLNIDYPRFKEIDKRNVLKIIFIYGLATFLITIVVAITHRLEFYEMIITLLIAGAIEFFIYFAIYHLYKRNIR